MASLLGIGRSTSQDTAYRTPPSVTPDKPMALPYEIRSETTLLDFSNPINPLGPPPEFVQAMHTALVNGELSYLPDRDGRAFRLALASMLGVSPDCVLLGSAPTQLMTYAAMAFELTRVGVDTPCVPEFLAAMSNAGHEVVELSNNITFAAPDAYLARERFGEFGGAVLGNPSYPASRLLTRRVLTQYLEMCDWVIVDESNIELAWGTAESMVDMTAKYPNLIIVRNPSTTFGIPGIPISCLVSHAETIETIAQFYDGSDINMFAEVLSGEMQLSTDYLDRTHDFLDEEIPWMQGYLNLIPGIRVNTAEANYVLCEFCPEDLSGVNVSSCRELVTKLQVAGFYVQPLYDTPGLSGNSHFCVSLRTREDNQRLLFALRSVICGE